MKTQGIAFIWMVAFCLTSMVHSPAQTYQVGVNFNAEDGAFPESPLIEGLDGNLYGTTFNGGGIQGYCFYQWGCGSIYTPSGSFASVLYAFCPTNQQGFCPDGSLPTSGLVQATDGNLYGTTQGGSSSQSPCGQYGCGTVFVFGNLGGLTTLHTFNYTDGGVPTTGLVQAKNGKLYGTTTQGGTNGNYGTLFEITLSGTLTTVYNFCALANCADGWLPSGPLVQGSDGSLYGETQGGGAKNGGTIFKVNSQGTLTTLYSFCAKTKCADGGSPVGGLIQAADGNFYGTTVSGGAYGGGTIFRITPAGKFTTLHSFCSQTNCTDGGAPYAGVIQATDGNLYGTTYGGGVGAGTIFELSAKGKFTTLYSFSSPDGAYPLAGLLEDTNGYLDGTTSAGGLYYFGTTYSLSVGLSSFVRATPNVGKVGAAVILNGPTSFFYATAVRFNGVPATFSIVNDSEISTNVPAGATTGKISVVTTFGTIKSAVPFRVIP
jgi:uncharacterized repeat protein (TIGR03803 family)